MNTLKNLRKVFAMILLLGLTVTFAVAWNATHVCAHDNIDTTPMTEPPLKMRASSPTAITSDAIILQWNEIAVATIGAQPPFPSTRFMATVQVAVV
jgi:hypothetical protein